LLLFFRKEVLALSLLGAAPERRVLRVSMYPYIPQAAEAALLLKQGFEAAHPDVRAEITLNPHYYSLVPADGGVLYENADVHTIDVVFLKDFTDRHRLAPLPRDLLAGLPKMEKLAQAASTVDGATVAVPQWMCTDFLFYRSDLAGLDGVQSLAGLERGLQHGHGLLLDMAGPGQIGELYFSSLVAQAGSPEAALARITPMPDPGILQRLRRMLALEPHGFGRVAAYDERYSFYARQFARRAGGAFVGYSEMTHEVLDETAVSCRLEDKCVASGQIRVAAFPFHDGAPRPAVWVDMFAIDARVHGQTLQDAADFIRFAVSLPTYRALLVPQEGEAPRYLLPPTIEAYEDSKILEAAPLYPKFRAIMEQGVVTTTPHLQAKLHDVSLRIDAALPAVH
jgi:thiamine pyridinylase